MMIRLCFSNDSNRKAYLTQRIQIRSTLLYQVPVDGFISTSFSLSSELLFSFLFFLIVIAPLFLISVINAIAVSVRRTR